MIILLSPAKTMNFSDSIPLDYEISKPKFYDKAIFLNSKLREINEDILKEAMNLSEKLSPVIIDSIQKFSTKNNEKRQAVFAYRGAVFKGMNSLSFTKRQISFAQDHLRILSGMYGVLKPLDGIEKYRLEMKTSLETLNESNLYEYWNEIVTNYFDSSAKSNLIINLASKEYSKVINFSKIKKTVINITFGEITNNLIKSPPMYSKIARGLMAGYIIRNLLTTADQLKDFQIDNYKFNPNYSNSNNFTFTR